MKFYFSILLTICFITVHAQANHKYLSDLNSLSSILKKTPSFKDQIKGEKLRAYNALFDRLRNDSANIVSSYKYFCNLAQLFFPIRDNHLGFYQINKLPGDSEYPDYEGNIDSLKSALVNKPLDSIEGIYYYGNAYKVGLFKKSPKEYVGVVFDSTTPIWKNGQIAVYLYEFSPNYFKAIYGHPKSKIFFLSQIEKFSHRSLVNSYFYSSLSESIYTKVLRKTDYVNLPRDIYDFHFKNLKPDIQYLHIKQFSASNVAMQKSQSFYDSIKNSLKAPNLIVDLRNNNGGAEKVSKKYFNLLKDYLKSGVVYVLVNNGTISQGEIFTLQLMKLKNVKVLGQTTRGMLVYGSNYGRREKLPSQEFEIYITDMKGDKWLLPYENYGVNPDIVLTDEKDWIEQTVAIIEKN